MIEARIDSSQFDRLINKLDQSPEVIRDAKRSAIEQAAPKLKEAVDTAIGGTGKVRLWQEQIVGSGGGYAAVRPKKETYTETNGRGKRYAVGHVTNAIDSGHKFPSPSGKDPNYRPNIRIPQQKVPGKKFYSKAEEKAQQIAEAAVEQVATELTKHLEG